MQGGVLIGKGVRIEGGGVSPFCSRGEGRKKQLAELLFALPATISRSAFIRRRRRGGSKKRIKGGIKGKWISISVRNCSLRKRAGWTHTSQRKSKASQCERSANEVDNKRIDWID
jgi:hypothetical protein